MKKIIKIEGMHCQNCADRITKVLTNHDVKVIKMALTEKEALVDTTKSDSELKKIITDLGYEVAAIEEQN